MDLLKKVEDQSKRAWSRHCDEARTLVLNRPCGLEVGFQVIVEKKRKRTEQDLVGKPAVHDPTWLKNLRRLSEQNKRKRKAQKSRQQDQ